MNAISPPRFVLAAAVAGVLGATLPAQALGAPGADPLSVRSTEPGQGVHGSVPVFVPDRGQWGDGSIFRARSGPVTARFALDGWTLACQVAGEESGPELAGGSGASARPVDLRGVAIRMDFEGASGIAPAGEDPIAGRFHYLLGADPTRWVTDVPGYGRIRYPSMYPGIDVVVRDGGGVLEYDLRLEPGADPAAIVIRCEGVDELSIESDGSLRMQTALGAIRQKAPRTWEESASGERRTVPCRYRLLDERRYGFEVSRRSARHALVIDPDLTWSSYLGGSDHDRAYGIAADDAGIVTVVGWTASTDLPITPGVFQTTLAGLRDGFVSRLDPSQSGAAQLLWSTYLGGSQDDMIFDVAVDPTGMATVAGMTRSPNFPGASSFGGGMDAFVARLGSSGAQLQFSTLLGGPQDDWACAVSVDESTLETTLGGITGSPTFPITANAYQGTYGGGSSDAFVSRVDLFGSLSYSTFLGGSADEAWFTTPPPTREWEWRILDLAEDGAGRVVVTGQTRSSNFRTTPNAFGRTHNGGTDAFVSRLDLTATGSAQLSWSTLLGGSSNEAGQAVGLQSANGLVAVSGYTFSGNFPTTPGAFQSLKSGASNFNDGIVSWFDPAQTGVNQLVYSTYLGSSGHDPLWAIHVDQRGFATVSGLCTQPAGSPTTYPTTPGCFQPSNASTTTDDAVLARLEPAGNGAQDLIYSTCFGGTGHDWAQDLAVDGMGGAWFVNTPTVGDVPITPGCYQAVLAGSDDVNVAHLNLLPFNNGLSPGVDRVPAGSGPHCDGPILFEVSNMPIAGSTFRFLVGNAPRSSVLGVLVIGFPRTFPPMWGMNLCTTPTITLPIASTAVGSVDLPVLYGGQTNFRVQVVWANNTTCTGSQPLSSSAALDF